MTKTRGVVIVTAAAAFVTFVVWALWPPSEQPYFDMVASLRAAGQPFDFDGLVPKRVAPADNGARDLQAGLTWLDDNVGKESSWKAVGPWNPSSDEDWPETSTPEQMQELVAFLAKCEPFFTRVAAAASKPSLQFVDGPRDVFGFPVRSGVGELQKTHRLLAAVTRAAPQESRRLDVMAWEASIAIRFEPTSVIGRMVSTAMLAGVVADLRREVGSGRLDPAAARARLDPLLRRPWLASLPNMFRGERVFLIGAYRSVLNGTHAWSRPPWYERLVPKAWGGVGSDGGLHSGMAVEVAQECDRFGRATAIPVADYAAYRKAVAAEMSAGGGFSAVVPGAGAMISIIARVESAQNLARVALAVAELHAKTGAWPASLDEIAPMFPDGVPRDRLTGGAFVYARTAKGVTISAPPDPTPARARTYLDLLDWELTR